jgi:hypothetical protein
MEIEEWQIVVDLMDSLDDMTDDAAQFVQQLFDYLDPNLPFLEQQSEKQLVWLMKLHYQHNMQDMESAKEAFEGYED